MSENSVDFREALHTLNRRYQRSVDRAEPLAG